MLKQGIGFSFAVQSPLLPLLWRYVRIRCYVELFRDYSAKVVFKAPKAAVGG